MDKLNDSVNNMTINISRVLHKQFRKMILKKNMGPVFYNIRSCHWGELITKLLGGFGG